jgi:uncharacterized surface protein with fasciclin (FAS1) repeats
MVETLLTPAMLTKILACHVTADDVMSSSLVDMIKKDGGAHKITTVGGCVLTAKISSKDVTLTDENGARPPS